MIVSICETSNTAYGVTDESGSAKVRVKGRSSPGCGITAKCEESTLRDPDGNIVANINLTQLLRGQGIAAEGYKLKVVRDDD